MKFYTLIIASLFLFSALVRADELSLMPYPQQVNVQSGSLVLGKDVAIILDGQQSVLVSGALERFVNRVEKQTGQRITLRKADNSNEATFIVRVNKESLSVNSALLGEDESYELSVNKKQIVLNANSEIGALRGFETLLQLIGTQKKIKLPVVVIKDQPRFKWRGLLLDTSRHFFSVNTIKRQIDAMAAAKYNIFHWHLTDDQGWRIESKKFPKLHLLASDGEFYTQDDIRSVVAYAHERGIYVLPEIDLPGHASAIAVAYPELMSAPGPYAMEYRWGVHKPTLNPANEKVYEFIDQLIAEITPLFPFEYIHMGGDEVDPEQWNNSADIKQFMKAQSLRNAADLQAYFNQRLVKILQKHQRKMIGWDEIQHKNLPKDIVIQSWRGPDAVADAASHDFQAILSTGFYLDQAQPAAYHYRNDPVPTVDNVNTHITADMSWQSWAFTMPRKRGKPVTGSFTLITAKDGKLSGFIDFKDKSRRLIHSVKERNGVVKFSVDSWMGQVVIQVVPKKDTTKGIAIVGNAPYEIQLQQIAGSNHDNKTLPAGQIVPSLTPVQQSLILGGEAALWAELVDESQIDLRLWPRAFVIAERLWSSEHLKDESNMYHRMVAITHWSRVSIGVQDLQQSVAGMQRLVADKNILPLQILSEAVEQAHYYHRQHEKSAYETYSKQDVLDRYVDTLPAESLTVRKLNEQVDKWLTTQYKDKQAKRALQKTLKAWKKNGQPLISVIQQNPSLASLEPIAKKVNSLSTLALDLIQKLEKKKKLTIEQSEFIQQQLEDAKVIDNEMVVAAVYPIEKLFFALQDLE